MNDSLSIIETKWQKFWTTHKSLESSEEFIQPKKYIFFIAIASLLRLSALAEDTTPPTVSEIFNSLPYSHAPKDPRCTMIPEKGSCKGFFVNYYYDPKTDRCREFIYGGCEGAVPFETQSACEKVCLNCDDAPSYPVKKPAIYLYPPKTAMINVHLHIKGTLTKTIPEYKDGWSVLVHPDGKINGGYDYLFYEANLSTIALPKEGWVVDYQGLEGWFETHLGKLGLNAHEKEQFKAYWLKELTPSPYYKIQLLDKEFLSETMGVEVHPKPDTVIRLNFYFTPLKQWETLVIPTTKIPLRKGFTLVEWGGIIDDPTHHPKGR